MPVLPLPDAEDGKGYRRSRAQRENQELRFAHLEGEKPAGQPGRWVHKS